MFPILDVAIVGLIAVALTGLRVAQEYERGVVFRLGRYRGLRGPGLYWIIPLHIERAVRVDIRTRTVSAEQQETITRDSVTIKVNAVLWYRIVDASKSVIAVADAPAAVYQLALTGLRNIIGQHDLDEILQERNKINTLLGDNISGSTGAWGLEVQRFEMKDVELPQAMQQPEAPDQIHGVNADGGSVAEQFTQNEVIRPSAQHHPHPPHGKQYAGDFADPQSLWRCLFQQHKHGDNGDPPDVHHSGDEQQRHEKPATSRAIGAVFQSHDERAVFPVAPVGHQKTQRRAAMSETGVLKRCPLKYSGDYEQRAAKNRTRADHHRRQQRGRVQNPLRDRRQTAERRPNDEIAKQKNSGGHKRLLALAPFAVHRGKGQNHRRSRRRHHGYHHFSPHKEQWHECRGRP